MRYDYRQNSVWNFIMLFADVVFNIFTGVLMLRIVFNVFSMMFAKTSLLFCCFCIRLFVPNYVCVVPYGIMRNLDAIIRVRMVLCKPSMLLFVFRIMFVLVRVFRELDRYGLARVIN